MEANIITQPRHFLLSRQIDRSLCLPCALFVGIVTTGRLGALERGIAKKIMYLSVAAIDGKTWLPLFSHDKNFPREHGMNRILI